MEFEFDPKKNAANKHKHGIDFVAIQELWTDVNFVEIPARTEDEPRFLVIGLIGSQHWSCVTSYRGERIKIISARRSRKEEEVLYENS